MGSKWPVFSATVCLETASGGENYVATDYCFTLKLPSAISMFVHDPELLLSQGKGTGELAWPNFGLGMFLGLC